MAIKTDKNRDICDNVSYAEQNAESQQYKWKRTDEHGKADKNNRGYIKSQRYTADDCKKEKIIRVLIMLNDVFKFFPKPGMPVNMLRVGGFFFCFRIIQFPANNK